jgi:hypothetical protein
LRRKPCRAATSSAIAAAISGGDSDGNFRRNDDKSRKRDLSNQQPLPGCDRMQLPEGMTKQGVRDLNSLGPQKKSASNETSKRKEGDQPAAPKSAPAVAPAVIAATTPAVAPTILVTEPLNIDG